MHKMLSIFGVVAVLVASPASAALVAELQMPAWLERDGQRVALQAGLELQDLDTIETREQRRLPCCVRGERYGLALGAFRFFALLFADDQAADIGDELLQ